MAQGENVITTLEECAPWLKQIENIADNANTLVRIQNEIDGTFNTAIDKMKTLKKRKLDEVTCDKAEIHVNNKRKRVEIEESANDEQDLSFLHMMFWAQPSKVSYENIPREVLNISPTHGCKLYTPRDLDSFVGVERKVLAETTHEYTEMFPSVDDDHFCVVEMNIRGGDKYSILTFDKNQELKSKVSLKMDPTMYQWITGVHSESKDTIIVCSMWAVMRYKLTDNVFTIQDTIYEMQKNANNKRTYDIWIIYARFISSTKLVLYQREQQAQTVSIVIIENGKKVCETTPMRGLGNCWNNDMHVHDNLIYLQIDDEVSTFDMKLNRIAKIELAKIDLHNSLPHVYHKMFIVDANWFVLFTTCMIFVVKDNVIQHYHTYTLKVEDSHMPGILQYNDNMIAMITKKHVIVT
jgi:hypothetical protein